MAAASTVMDKTLPALLVEEVKDILREERVEVQGVGLEVAVVYVEVGMVYKEVTAELEAVEDTLEEMVELMNSFVEEGEDLLTVGQISRMNVVLIGMDMVE